MSLHAVSRDGFDGRPIGNGRALESVGKVAPVLAQILAPRAIETIGDFVLEGELRSYLPGEFCVTP